MREKQCKTKNSMALVRERTVPTERLLLLGKVNVTKRNIDSSDLTYNCTKPSSKASVVLCYSYGNIELWSSYAKCRYSLNWNLSTMRWGPLMTLSVNVKKKTSNRLWSC
jgi:hypothetical protein